MIWQHVPQVVDAVAEVHQHYLVVAVLGGHQHCSVVEQQH
jgi:hypothetical protein